MFKSPKVQGFQGPGVPRSQGPKSQDISNSISNTSLTLKMVHLVLHYYSTNNLYPKCSTGKSMTHLKSRFSTSILSTYQKLSLSTLFNLSINLNSYILPQLVWMDWTITASCAVVQVLVSALGGCCVCSVKNYGLLDFFGQKGT